MSGFNWGDDKQWNNNNREPRMNEVVDMLDLSDGQWHTFRMVGPSVIHKVHWITIKSPKTGKITRIPKKCLGFDQSKPNHESGVTCPYCSTLSHNPTMEVYINGIERDIQSNMPRRQKERTKYETKDREWIDGFTGKFKESKTSGAWTPMRVLRSTSSLGSKIGELASLNTRMIKGKKKQFNPDHPKFGFDVLIKYNESSKTPANAYSAQKGDVAALEEEELDFLLWKIPSHEAESLEVAKKEAEKLLKLACDKDGKPLFDAGREEGKKKKKKNEYEDDFDADEDYEDDDKPKKKKKRPADDDDDDDDEPPKKKKGGKSIWDDEDEDDDEPPKKKRRPADDDDDDEDEPPKKKRRPADDDDDEDERPKKKKKRPVEDDDDDEPPRRKKKRRPADDDDDDDIPF